MSDIIVVVEENRIFVNVTREDPAIDRTGPALTIESFSGYWIDMVLQNGMPVACGAQTNATPGVTNAIAGRYNSTNLILDPTFGIAGLIPNLFGGSNYEAAEHIRVQPDGKVIIGGVGNKEGQAFYGIRPWAQIHRFDANGQAHDPTWGLGGAIGFSWSGFDSIEFALCLDANGNVFAGGDFDGVTASIIAKFLPTGVLDHTWGVLGWPHNPNLHSLTIGTSGTTMVSNADLGHATALTISAWIRLNSVVGSAGGSIMARHLSGSVNYNFCQAGVAGFPTELEFTFTSSGITQTWRTSGANLGSNSWTHVALTYDGSHNPTVYINGVSVGGAWATGGISTMDDSPGGSSTVGASDSSGSNGINGGITLVGIWHSSLSSGQIATLANATVDPVTLSPRAFWKFIEGFNIAVADFSGNGFDAHTNALWDQGKPWAVDIPFQFQLNNYGLAAGGRLLNLFTGGRLDPPYSGGPFPDGTFLPSVVADPAGNVYCGGNANIGPGTPRSPASVRKVNANGTLSWLANDIWGGNSTFDAVYAQALQADGKLVSAGRSSDATTNLQTDAISRLNTDGTLDTTFAGTGYLRNVFGTVSNAMGGEFDCRGIAIQADGKIVMVGVRGLANKVQDAMARINTNGTLDTSFGTAGLVIGVLPGINSGWNAVEIDSNTGRIFTAGAMSNNGSTFYPALARFTTNGVLDNLG